MFFKRKLFIFAFVCTSLFNKRDRRYVALSSRLNEEFRIIYFNLGILSWPVFIPILNNALVT